MDLVCLDLWGGEWPSLTWCFPFSFFQDWFSIWPNQSSKLVNQAEPVGLTGAGWNRAGKDKEAPFWKACPAEACSSPPASEHCPKREPIPLFTTPADGALADLGMFPSEKWAVWKGRKGVIKCKETSSQAWGGLHLQQRKLGGTMYVSRRVQTQQSADGPC